MRRTRAAKIILNALRRHARMRQWKQRLYASRQRQHEYFLRRQNELVDGWSDLLGKPRVIVHLPSIGIAPEVRSTLPNLSLHENYQIGRLCDIDDPNVDVIYVSPVTMIDEISLYYERLVSSISPRFDKYE
jgi:IQ domain-containing protein H